MFVPYNRYVIVKPKPNLKYMGFKYYGYCTERTTDNLNEQNYFMKLLRKIQRQTLMHMFTR